MLVRREAVRDIEIPENLHTFEDAFIIEWIEKKGYKSIPAYDPCCIHYRPSVVWTTRGSLDIIVDSLRYVSLSKMLELIPAYSFYAIYVAYRGLTQTLKLQ